MCIKRFLPRFFLLSFCLILFFSGCGGGPSDDREMGHVEGKIKVDGKAAGPGYTLYLDPENTKGTITEVGEGGTYSGEAVVGKNTATLLAPSSSNTGHGETESHGSQKNAPAYEPLTIEVKPSGTTSQDLDFQKK